MKIAFLCVANSARSQMAEGLARAMFPDNIEVVSAGSQPSRLNPLAVAAMRDVGIDISGHYSKSTDAIGIAGVDLVVTLCADEVCPVVPAAVRKLHWPLLDPAAPDKSADEQRRMFQSVREQIRGKLTELKTQLKLEK